MAKWAYHMNFAAEGKAFQERTGKIQAEVAKALETSLPTYRNYCYGSKKPSDVFIQRAAALFGCSITKFMDDPGLELAGQVVANMSEKRRFLSRLMFEGIADEDLSDEDAQLLWEDHCAAKARLIAMKNRIRQQGEAT